MPRRSVRDSQLRLGDSWVTEPTEDTSSDYDDDDDKGVPEHTPQRREVPRRLTRSSKKTIEPEPQRPSPRSMQRSRLHLGDSWIPENDGSSAIGEHATTSDHDEKGVPEEPLQGRETARKMTRSSKRTIEPESQRLSPRSMQESQLQLGDSWMPENDGSSAIGEHATSDHDDKGVPEKPLQGRETARKMTRSSRKTIEPELVMPAIDHDVGKSGHLDRIKSEETQRPPRRSVTEDASPRRRSARLANGDQKSSHQPSERLQQRPTAGRPRKRTVRDSLPTQVRTEWLVEPLVLWIFDTLMMVIRLLKYPASLFVAGLIIAAMISYLIALLSGLMSKAMSAPFSSFSSIPLRPLRPLIPSLSSICGLPIVSVLCPQGPAKSRDGNPPVKFDEMMKVQGKFEELLESATENYGLPQDMKRSEASIRDLRSLVRFSSLHSKWVFIFLYSAILSSS
ncbi:MAG: hypothetical protein M1816_006620 [Peltula sp. TS41687]|nr:MAG: hypothetical protein M1816_006620 [Peltula sp. TS41687]